MAASSKKNKFLKDYVLEDRHWKHFIKSENTMEIAWKYRWNWLLDEYRALKAKMDEQTANSQMLKRIIAVKKEDNRQLGKYPATTNHQYGYVATNPEMRLETWGPDFFKSMPLPDMYKVFKGDL